MSTKGIVVIVVLVVLVGASVFMWVSRSGGDKGADQSVMGMMQTFTCLKCGGTFDMSVAEASAMRRAHDGHIYCPLCGAEDPEKEGVVVRMGGMGGGKSAFGDEEDENKSEEEEEYSGPKIGAPGMKKTEP
ncbi:MAG: hypothetical protein JXQ75_00060 [Phycisphaerae bacterium]|nr:hypothetical protein [Phycisphaerae bacterium]